jgi:hypothetical protein
MGMITVAVDGKSIFTGTEMKPRSNMSWRIFRTALLVLA